MDIYSLYLIISSITYFLKFTSWTYIKSGGGQWQLILEDAKCWCREKEFVPVMGSNYIV